MSSRSMTRRERLTATFQGRPVDRPAVCFYEINGLDENPLDDSPFNIFSDPSWSPLLELAREKSDRIVLRGVAFKENLPDPVEPFAAVTTEQSGGSLFTTKTITVAGRTLVSRTRRDVGINTVWTLDHFIKSVEDLQALLQLPMETLKGTADPQPIVTAEQALGDTGVVMIDTPDPICLAAGLFSMELFTVIALTEQALLHRLLEKLAAFLYPLTDAIAVHLPGRPWRIYGPEYAAPPFLPPQLFRDYVVRYDQPLIDAIHAGNGFARLHAHGRLREILTDILATGCDGLDPIEPPPQGDMALHEVVAIAGRQLVLFGNLEVSDIENLPTELFRKKVDTALREGAGGQGRGFVLMPSACPIGRKLKTRSLENYRCMVERAEAFAVP